MFASAIRWPQWPISDKISAIVPWPTSSEKNSDISLKIEDFSNYTKKFSSKDIPVCTQKMPPKSGLECTAVRWAVKKFGAKNEFRRGFHALSLPWRRYVTFELRPWLWPACSAPWVNLLAQISTLQRALKVPRKPRNLFFAKMAAKTTPGSSFRPHSCSPPSTWSF